MKRQITALLLAFTLAAPIFTAESRSPHAVGTTADSLPAALRANLTGDYTTVNVGNGPAGAANPDILISQARQAAEKGDFIRSNSLWNRALNAGLDSLVCLEGLADNALVTGDYEALLDICPKIRALDDEMPFAYNYEAQAAAALGRLDTATARVVDVVKLSGIGNDSFEAMTSVADRDLGAMASAFNSQKAVDGNNPVWDECLGTIYAYSRLYDQAVDAFISALRLDPDNDADAQSLALLYNQLRRYDDALYWCDQALARNPGYEPYVLHRAVILRNQNKQDEAISWLTGAIAADSTSAPLYVNRGMLQASAGRDSRALADYDRALRLNPHSPLAMLRKGISEFNLGHKKTARQCFRKVVDMNYPDWGGTALANAYLGNRNAVEAFIKKAEVGRERADNYFNLAALVDVLGYPDRALDYLRRAISENALNPDIIPFDPSLRNVRATEAYRTLLSENGVKTPAH